MGTLVFITGKSGSGKDTIEKELLSYDRNLSSALSNQQKLIPMTLYTTRKKRDNESASDYIFLNEEEFMDKVINGIIKEDRLYYKSDNSGNPYQVRYGSSGVDFDTNNIYIGNGAIDQLKKYINMFLVCKSKSMPMCDYSSLGDIYDLSKKEIHSNSNIVVIYPFVTEQERLSRLIDRSSDDEDNYHEFYRRQYQDYLTFGDIYNILDNNARYYLSCNQSCMVFITFNKFSKITYCFLNNNIDYDKLHSDIIPILYKEIQNKKFK